MIHYIGVDPGKSGGISILSNAGVLSYPYSDESLIAICSIYCEPNCVAVVENVHAMPNQGVTSCFNFGKEFGYILGVFDSFNIPITLVSPQRWKKYFNLGRDKQESIDLCKEKFPELSLKRTERCKKDSDGMAEATLIALWGKENKCELMKP